MSENGKNHFKKVEIVHEMFTKKFWSFITHRKHKIYLQVKL